MNFTALGTVFISFLLLCVPLAASPLGDKVEAFKKALKVELADKPDKEMSKPVAAAYDDAGVLMARLDQIPLQMDSPNTVRNIEIQLSELLAAYSHKDVQATGQALLDEIHREREVRLEASKTTAGDLLKRATSLIPRVKKPGDLDVLVTDFQKFLNDRNGYNPEIPVLFQQVNDASEFTKIWQDYLSHLDSRQTQLAIGDLQRAIASDKGTNIIPRSHMLDLLTEATNAGADLQAAGSTETEKIIQGIKTLDDMEPALKQLSQLSQNDPQASRATGELTPLVQLYTSEKAGLPEVLDFNSLGISTDTVIRPQLQSQLLVLVLGHYFDTYKGPAPAPDEKPDQFVDKAMADALGREDWPLLKKVVAAKIYFNRSSALAMGGPNITVAVDDLLAGINQEAAGQYSLAVASYQDALKESDTTLPAKFIGDRLAELRKVHPADYEDGMRMMTLPAVTRNVPPPAAPAGK